MGDREIRPVIRRTPEGVPELSAVQPDVIFVKAVDVNRLGVNIVIHLNRLDGYAQSRMLVQPFA